MAKNRNLTPEQEQELIEEGICPECGEPLSEPVREDRGGAYPYEYSEYITYCPCGATFTSGI